MGFCMFMNCAHISGVARPWTARQLGLDIGEGLHVLFQVGAHEALHRMAVETDDVGQHGLGEHRCTARLFFENDLQQDAAGQVFAGLGVANHERFAVHHQLLDFGQRDVGGRVGW
jgi:hypothetical protein